MNDKFLRELRKDPPAAFVRDLRTRLRAHEVRAVGSRWRVVRNLLLVVAIAGSAYAGAFYAIKGVSPLSVFVDVRTQASNSSQVPAMPRSTPSGGQSTAIKSTYADDEPEPASTPAASGGSIPVAQSSPGNASTAGDVRGSGIVVPGVGNGLRGPARRDFIRLLAAPVLAPLARRMGDWSGGYPAPQIEVAGAAQAFRAFCSGVGFYEYDLVLASRRIGKAEFSACAEHGVSRIVELQIGYQAAVVVRTEAGGPPKLSPRDIFMALAKQIPDPADSSQLIDNPNRNWNQVNPDLDYQYIEVFGPPVPASKDEDFTAALMQAGCNSFPWIAALQEADPARHATICRTRRNDGAYTEIRESNELVSQTLGANPNAVAIIRYPFFKRHEGELVGTVLRGVAPSTTEIGSGDYPAALPFYLYVKKDQLALVPTLTRLISDGLREQVIGSAMLERDGLIPLSDAGRAAARGDAAALKELRRP